MAEPEHGSSPLAEALSRVGDRWTLLVVEALLPEPRRLTMPVTFYRLTSPAEVQPW